MTFVIHDVIICTYLRPIEFVFHYVYWCPTRFSCQKMFVSFSGNTTGVTSGAGTAKYSICRKRL
jgi:hypothetical protein